MGTATSAPGDTIATAGVPSGVLVAMGMVAVLCLVGPLIAQLLGNRRVGGTWAAFGLGVACFAITQLFTRIPLLGLLQQWPPWVQLMAPALLGTTVLSVTAALFEETGRLVLMSRLLRRRRLADGVAFGLGHGGLEAASLVGVGMITNIVMAWQLNAGRWHELAAVMPPEVSRQLLDALTGATVTSVALGGLERVFAITLHVALSVLILRGITRGRAWHAWALAVLVHSVVNLVAVMMLTVWHWSPLAVEAFLGLVAMGCMGFLLRLRRNWASLT